MTETSTLDDNIQVPFRSIKLVTETEEWPIGKRKGQKISRSTIWSWVDQGLLSVVNADDGWRTALVDVDRVRELARGRTPTGRRRRQGREGPTEQPLSPPLK